MHKAKKKASFLNISTAIFGVAEMAEFHRVHKSKKKQLYRPLC